MSPVYKKPETVHSLSSKNVILFLKVALMGAISVLSHFFLFFQFCRQIYNVMEIKTDVSWCCSMLKTIKPTGAGVVCGAQVNVKECVTFMLASLCQIRAMELLLDYDYCLTI